MQQPTPSAITPATMTPGTMAPGASVPRRRSRAGLVPSIFGVVLGALDVLVGGTIVLVAGGYALFVTLFGAPGHVSLSGLAFGAWVSLPVVLPLTIITLALAVIALVRRRVATPAGMPPSRGALVMGIMSLVLGGICALAMLAAIPLLLMEQCFSTQPCMP